MGQTEGRGEAFARARAQRHEPGTKWSPDGCRRRARAATRTGARWKQSYGELAGKWRGWGGSMGRGERNRRGPVTIWSPETRRRRVPRRGARVLRRQLARAQEREREEGAGAHRAAHTVALGGLVAAGASPELVKSGGVACRSRGGRRRRRGRCGARSSRVVEAEERGGAVGLVGEVNGRRWPRLPRAVARKALGHGGERGAARWI